MAESKSPNGSSKNHSRILIACVGVAVVGMIILIWTTANPSVYNVREEMLTAGTAETLTRLGKQQEALEVYTDLLEHSRSEAQFGTYYLKRGDLYFQMEQYEEAIVDYTRAIEYDPEGFLYQARWNLAQAYTRLGDRETAAEIFRDFLEEYGEELPQFTSRVNQALALLEE